MSQPVEFQTAQLAPTGTPDGASPGLGYEPFLLMGAMVLLMWALLIRPQQRQQKEHRKMLGEITKGDQVVTSGGLFGRVTGVTDDVLTLEIAERVRVKVQKSAVASRIVPGEGDKS